MKIIDLSLQICEELKVYSGDSIVNITTITTIKETGFEMKRLNINGHDGTHVNVQNHCLKNGKSIDSYSIENFIGKCRIFETQQDITSENGILFAHQNINTHLKDIILEKKLRFICLSSQFVIDEEIEKLVYTIIHLKIIFT